jgi:hypothetical protein
MFDSKTLTRLAIAAALCTAGTQALAHTGVKDQATVSKDSGATSYNAFTITHGCSGGEDGTPIKVKGQSAVFPYGDHTVWKNLANNNTVTAAHVIGNGVLFNLNPGAIQDSSLFSTVTEKADGPADPNAHGAIPVRAIHWIGGGLRTDLVGLTQFRVSVPAIKNRCVSKLRIRIAVANWCEKDQNQASDTNNNRADWWFTKQTGTKKFVDPDLIQSDFWTTLTVENSSVAKGEAADACPGGKPHEVAVMPSGADIDKYLPYAPFVKAPAPY